MFCHVFKILLYKEDAKTELYVMTRFLEYRKLAGSNLVCFQMTAVTKIAWTLLSFTSESKNTQKPQQT